MERFHIVILKKPNESRNIDRKNIRIVKVGQLVHQRLCNFRENTGERLSLIAACSHLSYDVAQSVFVIVCLVFYLFVCFAACITGKHFHEIELNIIIFTPIHKFTFFHVVHSLIISMFLPPKSALAAQKKLVPWTMVNKRKFSGFSLFSFNFTRIFVY